MTGFLVSKTLALGLACILGSLAVRGLLPALVSHDGDSWEAIDED